MIQTALYMIPVGLSDAPPRLAVPDGNIEVMRSLRHFIVENVRTARRFLKRCDPAIDISSITFSELNRHTPGEEISRLLQPLREGLPVGMMSEAGCPGVADPGAQVASIAQREGLRVIPLAGPSSILMSLMASGFNGQGFSFHGYLPIDPHERLRTLRELESTARRTGMTQIFIETPYRNDRMLDFLAANLRPDTLLCVAAGITDPEAERIVTRTAAQWKAARESIGKIPAIFLISRQ